MDGTNDKPLQQKENNLTTIYNFPMWSIIIIFTFFDILFYSMGMAIIFVITLELLMLLPLILDVWKKTILKNDRVLIYSVLGKREMSYRDFSVYFHYESGRIRNFGVELVFISIKKNGKKKKRPIKGNLTIQEIRRYKRFFEEKGSVIELSPDTRQILMDNPIRNEILIDRDPETTPLYYDVLCNKLNLIQGEFIHNKSMKNSHMDFKINGKAFTLKKEFYGGVYLLSYAHSLEELEDLKSKIMECLIQTESK
ncbi:MAG: hypothetical protein R2799_10890 [Crocinitomicaceae bacterium]